MMRLPVTAIVAMGSLSGGATAAEHDYYKNLRYPPNLNPAIGRDTVDQQGGADAKGYQRRTVRWWPRKGHDIVDVPEAAPLRTWTRNLGQDDAECQAGLFSDYF